MERLAGRISRPANEVRMRQNRGPSSAGERPSYIDPRHPGLSPAFINAVLSFGSKSLHFPLRNRMKSARPFLSITLFEVYRSTLPRIVFRSIKGFFPVFPVISKDVKDNVPHRSVVHRRTDPIRSSKHRRSVAASKSFQPIKGSIFLRLLPPKLETFLIKTPLFPQTRDKLS